MKNWLGQEIEVGSVVYRGARDGNTSSFKVGTVQKVDGRKVRVHWEYEPGVRYIYFADGSNDNYWGVRRLDTSGSPDIDSLVLLDSAIVHDLEHKARLMDHIGSIPRGTLTPESLAAVEAYAI